MIWGCHCRKAPYLPDGGCLGPATWKATETYGSASRVPECTDFTDIRSLGWSGWYEKKQKMMLCELSHEISRFFFLAKNEIPLAFTGPKIVIVNSCSFDDIGLTTKSCSSFFRSTPQKKPGGQSLRSFYSGSTAQHHKQIPANPPSRWRNKKMINSLKWMGKFT